MFMLILVVMLLLFGLDLLGLYDIICILYIDSFMLVWVLGLPCSMSITDMNA